MSEEDILIPVLLLIVPLLFMGVVVIPNIASFGGGIAVENPWYVNTTSCHPCGDGSTGMFDVSYHESIDIKRVPCSRDKWVDEPGEQLGPNAACYEMPDGSIAIGDTGE